SISTQDVSANVPEPVTGCTGRGCANARARRKRGEERAATCLLKFLKGHAGNRKVRVEIWPNWIPNQRADTTERCRWIRTIQWSEGTAALQCEESTNLPATQHPTEGSGLLAIKRKFVNRIDGESLGPVIGRAGTVRPPVK